MAALETVYAIHSFEAENDDEIAFSVGEPVIVLEKDDGYGDGWWQGRNVRGEIGLFPMNYTTYQQPALTSLETKIDTLEDAITQMQLKPSKSNSLHQQQQQLPTPSTSSSTRKSKDRLRNNSTTSLSSSYSTPRPTKSAASKLQPSITASLALPALKDTPADEWSCDQVAIWLEAMGFGSIADNFKAQEITGDILLELTVESLKELDVNTFGKRFKIYGAIVALHEELMRQQAGSQASTVHAEQDAVALSRKHDAFARDDRNNAHAHYAENDTVVFSSSSPISRPSQPPPPLPPPADHYSLASSRDERSTHERMYSMDTASVTSKQSTFDGRQRTYPSTSSTMINDVKKFSTPQNVLPVASRASMDGIAQRLGISDNKMVPDIEGWLHKQSDKYKTWNKRWFVLKGSNMFYFKGPKEIRMKGIINLRGYKIIYDESIHSGKYSFKAQHDRERTFYFYTDSEASLKAWIKALLKATISRDLEAPVMSSSSIPTVSLDIARRMKPRPPSMLLYRKDNRPQSPRLTGMERPLSIEDRPQPIMRMSMSDDTSQFFQLPYQGRGLSSGPATVHPQPETSLSSGGKPLQDSGFGARTTFYEDEDEDLIDPLHGDMMANLRSGNSFRRLTVTEEEEEEEEKKREWDEVDYLDWIQDHVDTKVRRLGDLRTGEILMDLLESLSGKEMRRPAQLPNSSENVHMLDNIVAAFKFMGREGVVVDGRYTIKDVFGGNETKIMEMLKAIRTWSEGLKGGDTKTASGGTFGDEMAA
ncbi:polar growth protein [Apophysomyces ossiformis]|uniref:Polar growth protein n=1 Tax=Apophysomyces ossiformis TaxID=679940 RepID=A0A8H7ETL9_9FUNG|nr:polar growth protein [Apophysomyces ossiformis]